MLPGTFLKFNIHNYKSISSKRFYFDPPQGQYLETSEEQLIDELEALLVKAVKRQENQSV